MKRRTFLQGSATGLGLASFGSLTGCGVLMGSRGRAGAVGAAHLVFDGDSPEFLISPEQHRVFKVDASGKPGASFGELGDGNGELNYPVAGAIDGEGNLYVLDRGNSRVVVYSSAGKHLRSIGKHGSGAADLSSPRDLVLDGKGQLFITDTLNSRIQVFATDGRHVRSIGAGRHREALNGPRGITIDSRGHIHCVDTGNARIAVFKPSGEAVATYGNHGSKGGEFLMPRSIVCCGSEILVGDPTSGFISVFREDGQFVERHIPRHGDGTPVTPLELSRSPGSQAYVWSGDQQSVHAADG